MDNATSPRQLTWCSKGGGVLMTPFTCSPVLPMILKSFQRKCTMHHLPDGMYHSAA
jgi:hypothetical protein